MRKLKFNQFDRSELQTQFWLRVFAFSIDVVLLQLLSPILLTIVFRVLSVDFVSISDYSDDLVIEMILHNSRILLVSYLIIFILYGSILESSKLQGTIGKWFLGFRIVNTDGKRISFKKALLRNVLKLVAIVSVVGVAIIDMIPSRQAIHDLPVKTHLTRKL
jgi:uncharacterized RDD family membrane protein YckC